jgi:2,5-diketo-D-gluconate reductase A
MSVVPNIALNDGRSIPQLGLGVFQVPPEDTGRVVAEALQLGYRHIDTAQGYHNERGVGEGVRASGLERSDVFVTSKLDNASHRPDDARRAFDRTLSELGFDHVDLFLVHWPMPALEGAPFEDTWKVLEELRREGRVRSIGVSNFEIEHLERLAAVSDVVPAVNQIELHPAFLNEKVRAYGESHGIATQAWSPLAQGRILDAPVITSIAEASDRTAAQVVLRWHIQRGTIVFPKSVTSARILENLELFDFELAPEDIARIDALDRGEAGRDGPHPNTIN